MNETIHGERTASEPQDRSSSVAHSIEVPSEIIRKWQEIVNLLAEIMHVPSASIMRVDPPHIKVFVSSTSKGNPCEPGALDTGPYCETVMRTGQPLLVPDALENEAWKANPHVRLGMISYLGVPIGWPDGRIFGTICVRDNRRNEYSEAYLKLLLHFRDMLQADLKALARLHGEIEEREARVERAESRLAAIISSSSDAIIGKSLDGIVTSWNTGAEEIFGYEAHEMIGQSITRIIPAELRQEENTILGRLRQGDRIKNYETVRTRKDGSRIDISLTVSPVFGPSGKVVGAAKIARDITAEKRGEAELQLVREELARVARITTLGQLTASIAHEITQPIASSRNNASAALNFLDQQPPDLTEVKEALVCVVADADRAGDILGRISDHIKKAPPRKDRVDLNEAINEVIVLVRSTITKNAVAVQTRLAEGLLRVHADRIQLQQVVMNLILNAVDAMGSVEAGARELLISTKQSEANGIVVAVGDSGPGIDPENLECVFEAFYTTKSNGVGMGLSICRSIIESHGGRLWATRCEPRGALFQFTIPAD